MLLTLFQKEKINLLFDNKLRSIIEEEPWIFLLIEELIVQT